MRFCTFHSIIFIFFKKKFVSCFMPFCTSFLSSTCSIYKSITRSSLIILVITVYFVFFSFNRAGSENRMFLWPTIRQKYMCWYVIELEIAAIFLREIFLKSRIYFWLTTILVLDHAPGFRRLNPSFF